MTTWRQSSGNSVQSIPLNQAPASGGRKNDIELTIVPETLNLFILLRSQSYVATGRLLEVDDHEFLNLNSAVGRVPESCKVLIFSL